VVDDLAGLLGLVEIGAVELHPWNASVDEIEHPDMRARAWPGISWSRRR
jgi:DNA primase